MTAAFDTVLARMRAAHARFPVLDAFVPLPADLRQQPVAPRHRSCADAALSDPALAAATDPLAQALMAAAPRAHWRETYAETDIGDDFLNRFGCYCLIGENGPWQSDRMAAYVVTMPAGLEYPWHHHPAEEMYFVLAGKAEFRVKGAPPRVLGPGQEVFHASNQPHAMQTRDKGVMAYVLWRGDLATKPVWSAPPAQATTHGPGHEAGDQSRAGPQV